MNGKNIVNSFIRCFSTKKFFYYFVYYDFPKIKLWNPDEVYVHLPQMNMWYDGEVDSLLNVTVRNPVNPDNDLVFIFELMRDHVVRHNDGFVVGSLCLLGTMVSDYIEFYKDRYEFPEILYKFVDDYIRINTFKSMSDFQNRCQECINWLAGFEKSKNVCCGYYFTRYFFNLLPKKSRDLVVETILDKKVSFQDKYFIVIYEFVANVLSSFRMMGSGISVDQVSVIILSEICLVVHGGIYSVSEKLFPYLFSTECDIEWKYIKFPQNVMVFDYGNTMINYDVVEDTTSDKEWIGDDETRVKENEKYEFRGVMISKMDNYINLVTYGIEYNTNEELHSYYTFEFNEDEKPKETIKRVMKHMTLPVHVINLVLATILYINLHVETLESKKEYDEIDKQIKTIKNPKKIRILEKKKQRKRNFIYINPFKSLRVVENAPIGSGYVRKINKLVSVRGYFRNQPYGEKMSLRKIVWIEPHFRGLKYLDDGTDASRYKLV